MSYRLIPSDQFERDIKLLAKRFKKIKEDLLHLKSVLENDPTSGTALGQNCYKIRLQNSSVPVGKSGGFRIVTLVKIEHESVYLLTIYSKSDQEDIDDLYLKRIIEDVSYDER